MPPVPLTRAVWFGRGSTAATSPATAWATPKAAPDASSTEATDRRTGQGCLADEPLRSGNRAAPNPSGAAHRTCLVVPNAEVALMPCDATHSVTWGLPMSRPEFAPGGLPSTTSLTRSCPALPKQAGRSRVSSATGSGRTDGSDVEVTWESAGRTWTRKSSSSSARQTTPVPVLRPYLAGLDQHGMPTRAPLPTRLLSHPWIHSPRGYRRGDDKCPRFDRFARNRQPLTSALTGSPAANWTMDRQGDQT